MVAIDLFVSLPFISLKIYAATDTDAQTGAADNNLGAQQTFRTSSSSFLQGSFSLDRPVWFSLLLLWCFCFDLYENAVLKKRCKPNTRLNGRSNPLELGELAMRDGA